MVQYTYTTVKAPGNPSLFHGLNNSGTEVGTGYLSDDSSVGLIDDDGTVSTFQIKFQSGPVDTSANGVNDKGEVAGYFINAHGAVRGFTYNDGRQAVSYYQGSTNTYALGVNNAGTVVGAYSTKENMTFGYVEQGGKYSTVQVDHSAQTQLQGINNAGEMVGFYTAANGRTYGFSDVGGQITTFDRPGARDTFLFSVNDQGDILGENTDAQGRNHYFIYKDGRYQKVTFPAGTTTPSALLGINNSDTIVGFASGKAIVGTPTSASSTHTADLSHALFDAAFGHMAIDTRGHDAHRDAAAAPLAVGHDTPHAHVLKA